MTDLLEELSKIEHQQWMHWTKWLVKESSHEIPEGLENKWRENWKPYEELSEEEKEKDRKWGRKVMEKIEQIPEVDN